MKKEEIIIGILAFVTGTAIVVGLAAWNANNETSMKNWELREEIAKLQKNASTTENSLEDNLKQCEGERQMHKSNFDMCRAKILLYEYGK